MMDYKNKSCNDGCEHISKKPKKLNPHELGRPYIQIVETRDMRPVIG